MPVATPQKAQHTGLVSADGKTFPLTHARLKTQAQGGMAHTLLTQEYRNPHAEPLEVIYTLPLPADGAVLGYTITLGERIVRGEIKPREEAREEYYKALEAGHTAGLLEQERADTFTQTLGNLPAGENVKVEIEVLQPLAFDCATPDTPASWTYRFPTVVGVRYNGEPGRVPDADKLAPPRTDAQGTPVRLELEMQIAGTGATALAPRSSSHSIQATQQGDNTRVELTEGSRLDRDLVLSWTAVTDSVHAALVEGRGLEGDDGRYALLTVTPPMAPGAVQPRDLTVLLDCSGSMSGPPLEQAKEVIRKMMASLGDEDRIEVSAFSTQAFPLTRKPVAATDARGIKRLLDRLAALQAGGATEMQSAISEALKQLRPESQRQVVLITDGYIGFEAQVVGEVMERLPAGTRLHTVGIGHAPNRSLTRSVARAGRGVETIVGDTADVEQSVDALLRGTAAPVLTDLVVTGSAVNGVRPERLRDVFAGQPLVAALELQPEGGDIEIVASLAGQKEAWEQKIEVGPVATADAVPSASVSTVMPIGALYGREAVEDCELAATAGADRHVGREDVSGEIEALGLRHRIVTRQTSLVAISEDPTVDPRDPRRRERLAVEMPAGVSAEGVGLAAIGGMDSRLMSRATYAGACHDLGPTRAAVGGSAPRFRRLYQSDEMDFDEPPALEPIAAHIIRREKDLLVIEFIAPDDDDFRVPSNKDAIEIEFGEGLDRMPVRLDRAKSTRPGRCPAGTVVRLVLKPARLKRKEFARLPANGPMEISWDHAGQLHTLRVVDVYDEDF